MLPSTCCELQWTAWHCSGVIPSLMRPDCQLWTFNAEVTGSSTIALSCSHSCLPTLVPSFGDDREGCSGWRIALSSQDTNSPRTWRSSAISPSSFEPFFVILGCFSPRLGIWAYYSKWAGAPRSFDPTTTNKCLVKIWKYAFSNFKATLSIWISCLKKSCFEYKFQKMT